jgi:F420-dependent oxidoreductase-like protein
LNEVYVRFGIYLPESEECGISGIREALLKAVDDGFSSAWLSSVFGLDALTTLAVAGSGITGIEVGTAVVPTYPRHPVTLAQQALTAALALDVPLTLGIGLSHKMIIDDMYGLSFDAPVTHITEYLSILQPLLAGQPVKFTGRTMNTDIKLSVPRTKDIPLLLAALAPRMLRLAGQRADGTILWMTGPTAVREYVVPSIVAAAKEVGRPDPRVVCILPVCVTDDPAGARAHAAEFFPMSVKIPSFRAMIDREGADGPGDIVIAGNEDSVTRQILALADYGVSDFVLFEYAKQGERLRTRNLIKKLASG